MIDPADPPHTAVDPAPVADADARIEPSPDDGQPGADLDLDLDAVERDLSGVETALGRLDDGTYWTDEVTGGEIPDEVLAENPTARRA